MICFPNAKINLGLQVTRLREDGFHNLRSVVCPVPLYDAVEFKASEKFSLTVWGTGGEQLFKNNLIEKGWQLLSKRFDISAVEVHLLKNIPVGSGLGGGSADAIFFLKELLAHFQVNLAEKELLQLAAELCSDCSFFVFNKPAYVIGRGNVVEPLDFSLAGFYLMLVVPDEPVSTPEAFRRIVPKAPEYNLKKVVMQQDFDAWQKILKNDFEAVVPKHLLSIKQRLYDAGALYASLTGSGSAFYGIFKNQPEAVNIPNAKTVVLRVGGSPGRI